MTDDEKMEVIEDIEESWEEGHVLELDKSWDCLHRLLTDGRLEYSNGSPPLSHAVLGGIQLHEGDDYVVSVADREMVPDIAKALAALNRDQLAAKYQAIDDPEYASLKSDEDLEYTLNYFSELVTFYQTAAEEGRDVIFTVDL